MEAHPSRDVYLLHILYPMTIDRSSLLAIIDLGHLPGTNLCVRKLHYEYRVCSRL